MATYTDRSGSWPAQRPWLAHGSRTRQVRGGAPHRAESEHLEPGSLSRPRGVGTILRRKRATSSKTTRAERAQVGRRLEVPHSAFSGEGWRGGSTSSRREDRLGGGRRILLLLALQRAQLHVAGNDIRSQRKNGSQTVRSHTSIRHREPCEQSWP